MADMVEDVQGNETVGNNDNNDDQRNDNERNDETPNGEDVANVEQRDLNANVGQDVAENTGERAVFIPQFVDCGLRPSPGQFGEKTPPEGGQECCCRPRQ